MGSGRSGRDKRLEVKAWRTDQQGVADSGTGDKATVCLGLWGNQVIKE